MFFQLVDALSLMSVHQNGFREQKYCNVCEQSFDTPRALAIHTSAKYTHDGLQRNELNEIVFTCNHCNKTFRSQKSLYNHRRIAKHQLDGMAITGAAMEPTPEEAQDVYSSIGHIRNGISHEKERVIELSISMALGRVHLKLPMS